MSRLRHALSLALLLHVLPAIASASDGRAPHVLRVVRATTLYCPSSAGATPVANLPADAVLLADAADGTAPPNGFEGYQFVTVVSSCPGLSGWVRSDAVAALTVLATPRAAKAGEGGASEPALVSKQEPPIRRAWKTVAAAVEEGTQLPKELPEPYLARAQIWAAVGNPDGALRDYLKAADLVLAEGQDPVNYSRHFVSLRRALLDLKRARPDADGALAASLYFKGLHSFFGQDLDAAMRNFDDAVQMAPGEPRYWYFRALTYKLKGEDRSALHDVRVGVYLENNPLTNAAYAEQLAVDFERVQGPLRRWLEGFRAADPSYRLAGLQKEPAPRGRQKEIADPAAYVDQLLADFAARKRAAPGTAPAPPTVAEQPPAFRRAWQNVQVAIADAKKLGQELPEPYLARAGLWAMVHENDRALEDCLKAINLDAASKKDLVSYSKHFLLLRESLDRLERMPKPPSHGSAARHYSRGLSAYRAGQWDEALRYFDEAVQLMPLEPVYWYYRGLTQRAMGHGRQARDYVLVGAQLEAKHTRGPALSSTAVVEALEGIQGPPRVWMREVLTEAGR